MESCSTADQPIEHDDRQYASRRSGFNGRAPARAWRGPASVQPATAAVSGCCRSPRVMARFTAHSTASSEAVTMLACRPIPNRLGRDGVRQFRANAAVKDAGHLQNPIR